MFEKLETEKNEFDQLYAVAFVRNRANLDVRMDSLIRNSHLKKYNEELDT